MAQDARAFAGADRQPFSPAWGSLKQTFIDCEGLTTYEELTDTVRAYAGAKKTAAGSF